VASGSAVPGEIWHEQIVVTATRSPSEAGTIPLYSSVLEAEQIRAAPDGGALELLRQVPSLNVARDTGTLVAQPRDQAISFRGLVGSVQSRALPLVDGLPISDPYGGWVSFSVVPKELVERVEIVRGGGSSAWGNLALSGVVNLITRAPAEREFGATLRLGERATTAATVVYGDARGPWAGWIAADALDTDGYVTVAPADRGAVDEPKFRRYGSLHGRLGWSSGPATLWTARGLYYDERLGLGLATDRDDSREISFSAALDHLRDGRSAWRAQLFHRELDLRSTAGLVDATRSTVEPESEIAALPSRATGASLTWSAARGRHQLTAGGDLVDLAIERDERLGWDGDAYTSRYLVRGRQRLGGLFVQDGVTLGARASLRFGARLDRVWSGDASSVRSRLPDGAVAGRDAIADHAETAFNPSLGGVVALGEATRLRGAVYTGFRYGTPSELFAGSSSGGRSVTVPNARLAPERLVGGEVGLDYTPSRRVALRLTAFRNDVDDLIQRILIGTAGAVPAVVAPCGALPAGGRCFQRRNLGEIRSTGFEIGADYRPSEAWRWTLDATLMESRIVENPDDPALEGNQVERAPDGQIAAAVEYRHPRAGELLVRGRYVTRAYDDAENLEELPAHALVDLSWARSLGPRWQLFAGVENALDRRYVNRYSSDRREVSGPRLWHVGLRLRAGAGD
jgi:outer membrane receptor protein involved in Fe transport